MTKKFFFLCFFFVLSVSNVFSKDLDTLKQANYILGYTEGLDLKNKMYILDFPSFKQGLLDGYANHIPDSIEDKREDITESYVSWILEKQTSTFSPAPLDKKTIETFSYFVGADYGKDFKLKYFTLSPEDFVGGLKDSLESKKPEYNTNDPEILKEFYQKTDALRAETENNKSIELVQDQGFNRKLDKGISYSLVSIGNNAVSPTIDSEVTIKYSLSELEKDHITNIKQTQEATFQMKDLAEGIRIALLSMQEGEHSIFSIPTLLLFVEEKSQPTLSKTLFDVTLVSVNSNSKQQKSLKTLSNIFKEAPTELTTKKILPTRSKKSSKQKTSSQT